MDQSFSLDFLSSVLASHQPWNIYDMSSLTTEDFRRGGAAYPSTWHFEKDLPKDRKNIEKTFKVLREYSGIPADKVEEHVINIVRHVLPRVLGHLRVDETCTHSRRLSSAGVMPKLTP